ncbi:hypothetical protein [Halomicrobium salinisoli]|uniref:hypothetical protein n=1 Tax=Halomicrobium salinisoli TaxID=2878391 RepID=UPI001CEFF095|nr:hypothetical protein [Halomicrobium salinisoli]
MEQLRSVLGRIVGSIRDGERSGEGVSIDRIYRCTYCHCTYADKLERCPECRIGQLVRSGPGAESAAGLRCRDCHAAVDARYERCPDCGCPRLEDAG